MNLFRFGLIGLSLVLSTIFCEPAWAEPKLQILSPKDGAQISQDEKSVFVSGKVARETGRSGNVDILFVIDVSGSTALYSGADLGDPDQPPATTGFPMPQISIGGMGFGGFPSPRNTRNSVLAAEVAAARRLLSQLNQESTRIGVINFSDNAHLLQPLTHDYERVRQVLADVLRAGSYGGTNMVEAIRMGISELIGFGTSEKRTDAIKAQFLLTDGFPTLPIGESKRMTPEDISLTINAARLSGKAGIKVHVFALGEEALSYPQAAVGIAKESGGTYTPVMRPADALAVLENISVVGVDYVQVVNQTIGQKATLLRLAADGFFSSAVPVTEGKNQIDVLARASDGSNTRQSITIYYQPGTQKSLDLEIFLEKEKNLQLEVNRLGKSPAEIQREIERNRQDSLSKPNQLPPPTDGPAR